MMSTSCSSVVSVGAYGLAEYILFLSLSALSAPTPPPMSIHHLLQWAVKGVGVVVAGFAV
jgi:hypothetical protein